MIVRIVNRGRTGGFTRRCGTASLMLIIGLATGLTEARAAERQDGRYLPKLEWVSPHGEQPGTYLAYLDNHPPTAALFGNGRLTPRSPGSTAPRGTRTGMLSILIHSGLFGSIHAAVDNYVNDLTLEGYTVYTETVSGGTPTDIKTWVQQRYAAGSDGILFIGDITAAWAEVSGAVFPCDLFYMDLDGTWQDTNGDGVFDAHSAGGGDEGPELYVARLYATTLSWDTESNMVNGYLAKAGAYRDGVLTEPWRGLEYVDEDWHTMDVGLSDIYGSAVARHDFGWNTTAADYLNQLDLMQHFVQVCAHSYSVGHHFGMRPTDAAAYASVYVHSPTARSANLLLGSDDGIKVWLNADTVCTHEGYQQGWQPDQYVHTVGLEEGWNRLLCKVSQRGGDYQFSARFTGLGGATFTDLEYQINDPATHGPDSPFIRKWLVNAFHQDIAEDFYSYLTTNYLGVAESTLNPLEGEVMGAHVWTSYTASGAYVDLEQFSGGADYGVSYAFVRVISDAQKTCQLWLGYDDGARVWLNRQGVVYDNRYGKFTADMTKVNVSLNAGENRLLVKVSEWMSNHGFSARFCQADGSPVDGLTYDPTPPDISHIGQWALNGPYANADDATRLTQDYLGGEASVWPSVGDPAPLGTWDAGLMGGLPCDLVAAYDHGGGWVYSQDIQDRDPPALFYNLFSCGPGRFTDDDYLAGSYIFNTTSGLITVASAKSGSMLNFHDFTTPLGQGASVGTAFREWFNAQAPFEQWEREWYYGMVLCGDPTLRPTAALHPGDLDCDGDVDFDDINPFVLALSGQAGYYTQYPDCNWLNADCDEDGDVDFDDINPFVALLGN